MKKTKNKIKYTLIDEKGTSLFIYENGLSLYFQKFVNNVKLYHFNTIPDYTDLELQELMKQLTLFPEAFQSEDVTIHQLNEIIKNGRIETIKQNKRE